LWDKIERKKKLFAFLRFFSVVSHNGKYPLLLYPATEENLLVVSHSRKQLFRYIPQRKKTSSVVSHNGNKTLNLNSFTKNISSAK
jgi:hypothetical protein